ncbi:MAG: ABC transporter permease [Flavobacteriales bacterium]|jgi:lipoprotein-releasing system permease protein|nr:ABC transporter permease [Flavobacteriales bacterium]
MNIEYFIAKRLFTAKEENNSDTKPILRIAILAIALSVAVMLLSVMVVTGFKNDISDKIIGFGSHITISSFSDNQSYETEPITISDNLYTSILGNPEVKQISTFATKAGIIKTNDEILGVVLKGVSSDYDWTFFNDNLVGGECLHVNDSIKTNQVLISESSAKSLRLGVGDNFIMYFVQDPPRARKFEISGVYNTALADFDKLFVMGDIQHIQSLNAWENKQVGGIEIVLNNFNNLELFTDSIYEKIPYNLNAQSIKEKTPQIFDWLDLQDVNVRVILILMLIVGGINMITALLILILERTNMIGILKALGANNWSVRRVFLYSALNLILKGLFWGNFIALGFAFLQKQFSIISLDPTTYYMNTVPINFDFTAILLLNVGTIIVCYLILIIPSIIITKITPVKAIRFA